MTARKRAPAGCDATIEKLGNIGILNGRSGEIRTPDPLVPNQMRYQTALHSVP